MDILEHYRKQTDIDQDSKGTQGNRYWTSSVQFERINIYCMNKHFKNFLVKR